MQLILEPLICASDNTNQDDTTTESVPFFVAWQCTPDSWDHPTSPLEPGCEAQDQGTANTRLRKLSQRKRSFVPPFLLLKNWAEKL